MAEPATSWRSSRRLLCPLIVLVAATGALVVHDRSFDLQYHLFFADHYARGWFEAWEPGWYGGFLVYCYPPLAHQLLALLGYVVGLDAAGRILTMAVVAAIPLALGRLVRLLGGPDAQYGFGVILMGWTAPLVFVVIWGQIAALIAFTFAVLAAGSLLSYLSGGRSADCALWAVLAGCCAGAHHQTAFFMLPLLAVTVIVSAGAERRVRRCVLALALGAVASVAALLPHLWWLATQDLPQAPIPHPSRSNFFADPFMARLFFFALWGSVVVVLPTAWAFGLRHRRFRPWAVAAALCAILGLGTITPLPRILFPGWSEWLTYERFALWGSALTAVLGGCWLGRPRGATRVALLLFGGAFSVAAVIGWILPNQGIRADDPVVSALSVFIQDGDSADWRYLTVGLGASRVSRLSRLSGGTSVDGFYFMARRDHELRRSGVGLIDEAFSFPNGVRVLDRYLSDPASVQLRWIFSADARAEARLRDAGWNLRRVVPQAVCKADALWKCAQIWEAPDGSSTPRASQVTSEAPAVPTGFGIWWGIVPLGQLLVAVVLAASIIRRTRASANREYLDGSSRRESEQVSEGDLSLRPSVERNRDVDDRGPRVIGDGDEQDVGGRRPLGKATKYGSEPRASDQPEGDIRIEPGARGLPPEQPQQGRGTAADRMPEGPTRADTVAEDEVSTNPAFP